MALYLWWTCSWGHRVRLGVPMQELPPAEGDDPDDPEVMCDVGHLELACAVHEYLHGRTP